MMSLKLQPWCFDYIKNGTKRIELRLNDEKRSLIKLGDNIKLIREPKMEEEITIKVIGLLKYNSFDDLFNDFDIAILADREMPKDDFMKELEKFYTKEKQEEYGVLGIRFEIC